MTVNPAPLAKLAEVSPPSRPEAEVDELDLALLRALAADARQSQRAIARQIEMSPPAVADRLARLERSGVIRGYRAVIDPAAIGLGFEVLVYVTMDREDASTITEFERGLAAIPQIRHAERLFGDPDYLIRVATADLASYQTLRDERLATLPGVHRVSSTIVMKRIVDDRPYLAQPAAADVPRHRA